MSVTFAGILRIADAWTVDRNKYDDNVYTRVRDSYRVSEKSLRSTIRNVSFHFRRYVNRSACECWTSARCSPISRCWRQRLTSLFIPWADIRARLKAAITCRNIDRSDNGGNRGILGFARAVQIVSTRVMGVAELFRRDTPRKTNPRV